MSGDTVPFEAEPVAPVGIAAPVEAPFVFTGAGGEYFRVWVVNTVLSIATIGIYSAWAKVRKTSYFSRNTRLLGDGFEFTADPLAILRGRLIALALLGFYTFAFDFSLTLGLVATTTFLALAPLLFASALRFRLYNTRWRALRFTFTATRADAYGTMLIVIGLWLSTSVAAAFDNEKAILSVTGITLFLLPWMHYRIKAFQHRHVAFGGHRSAFRSAAGRFYLTYLIAFVFLFLAGVGAALIGGTALFALSGSRASQAIGFAIGTLVAALAYLAAWPYFAARIQRVVWERTTLGPFSFTTAITFRGLLPIALKNFALIAITAGLYWPFASIAWARYRIGCMSIVGPESLDAAVAGLVPATRVSAVGEGAADFFGIDVGW